MSNFKTQGMIKRESDTGVKESGIDARLAAKCMLGHLERLRIPEQAAGCIEACLNYDGGRGSEFVKLKAADIAMRFYKDMAKNDVDDDKAPEPINVNINWESKDSKK